MVKLKINNFSVHYFDYKKINFYILMQTLFYYIKFRSNNTFKYIYLKKYLENVKPKIAIGHNFNEIMFKLKNLNSSIISIVYLHNRLYLDQIKNLKKNSPIHQ